VQDLGQQIAGDDFSLINEFTFPEQPLPYFDEIYEYGGSSLNIYYHDMRSLSLPEKSQVVRRLPVLHFVYSDMVSMKMNLADAVPNVHLSMSGRCSPTTRPISSHAAPKTLCRDEARS
jgi:hypothetical protein